MGYTKTVVVVLVVVVDSAFVVCPGETVAFSLKILFLELVEIRLLALRLIDPLPTIDSITSSSVSPNWAPIVLACFLCTLMFSAEK